MMKPQMTCIRFKYIREYFYVCASTIVNWVLVLLRYLCL